MSIKSSSSFVGGGGVRRSQNYYPFLSWLLLIGILLLVRVATLDGIWSFQHPIIIKSPTTSTSTTSGAPGPVNLQRKQGCQWTSRFLDTSYNNNNNNNSNNRNRNHNHNHNRNHETPIIIHALSSLSLSESESDKSDDQNQQQQQRRQSLEQKLSLFTLFTPLWTLLVSFLSLSKYTGTVCSNTVGSLFVMQKAYTSLMFVMGLTINNNNNDKNNNKNTNNNDTNKELSSSSSSSSSTSSTSPLSYKKYASILLINAVLCFGVMPLFAHCLATGFSYSSSDTIGIILLGCVGGGQASNLFTLIAGGDVGLSILCTISTTLLGVIVTPFLVSKLLVGGSAAAIGGGTGVAVATGYYAVVKSISSLILVPIIVGAITARLFPKTIQKISAFLPPLGVLSTLVLVAGGSSTTFVTVAKSTTMTAGVLSAILIPSILLSLLGAVAAWCLTSLPILHLDERTKKTLVMETLSKSPTLAYVLAMKHFTTGTTAGTATAASMIPAAAMVTLAVIGALVASIWATMSNSNSNSSSTTSTSRK